MGIAVYIVHCANQLKEEISSLQILTAPGFDITEEVISLWTKGRGKKITFLVVFYF